MDEQGPTEGFFRQVEHERGLYGYPLWRWRRMIDEGQTLLERRAARDGVTDYSELAAHLRSTTGASIEAHEYALKDLLGQIADRSWAARGAAITGIVLYRGGTDAGGGFYVKAQQLGALAAGPLTPDQKLEFQAVHTRAIHDAYRPAA